MPNAEGRMEVTQEQIDEAEYDVRQSMAADDRQTKAEYNAGERGLRRILDALAARTREVEEMREEIAAMMRYDAQSTELLDWLMAHLSFHEWQRLGVPDPRRPRTRSDLLAARSYALAAQEGGNG